MLADREQPVPEQVKVWLPAVSGAEPLKVTLATADDDGLPELSVCRAMLKVPGLPALARNLAVTLCSV